MDHLTLYSFSQTLADLPADESWLAAGERDRVAVFRFPKRRNDWLLGRWTAKQALHSFLAQSGHDAPEYRALEIRSAPDGAPEVFLNGQPAPVSLALSHSGREAFCVISRPGIALGCDLEAIQARDQAFIEDYLGDEERLLMAHAPAEEQPLLATLIWSAKESALKCLREGLRRDTRSVLVSVGGAGKSGWSSLTVRCLESSRLFYGWWRSAGGYVQTVTAELPAGEPLELRV
jgi:4'-phosphopantetheinyl transferase